MKQLSAFPIDIVNVYPASGSADAAMYGEGANGLEYCIKTIAKTPAVPAAEMFCYQLASACGLPTAQFDIVKLNDGSLAFGSVWDATALDRQDAAKLLVGLTPGRAIQETIAATYAFDLFLHNIDRHPGNYLCVRGRTAGHSVKLFDFSRAFTWHGWPLPNLPMDAVTMTVQTRRAIGGIKAFEHSAAGALLDRILGLKHETVKTMVGGIPDSWLKPNVRRDILKWWAGPKDTRVKQIRKGLTDGSLL